MRTKYHAQSCNFIRDATYVMCYLKELDR
jgi:hypothetical protein